MTMLDEPSDPATTMQPLTAAAATSLRRVQFDIERGRPATLVLVPDRPADVPQVLAIPPQQYAVVGEALSLVGQRLADVADSA